MNSKLEHYLDAVVLGLPMEQYEKDELKEELFSHVNEHVNELLIKGFSEEEAIEFAIHSFGNERNLNRELKKTMFPYYKIVRYVWNVFFVTAFLSLLSFLVMEFYNPQFDNWPPLESVFAGMFLVAIGFGVAEILYEAVIAEYISKWLTNTWSFFLIPSLFVGGLMSFSILQNPEQYQDAQWLDSYVIPISTIAYLLSRQLFSLLFLRKKKHPADKNAKKIKETK